MAGNSLQQHTVYSFQSKNIFVDLSSFLEVGEDLSGTPQAAGSDNLEIGAVQINKTPIEVGGDILPPGRVVFFSLSPTAAEPGEYNVIVSCTTDSLPPKTVSACITIIVPDIVKG